MLFKNYDNRPIEIYRSVLSYSSVISSEIEDEERLLNVKLRSEKRTYNKTKGAE